MTESVPSTGIDPLSVRLHELAGHFAAPTAGRLTEEQRALSLAIARRLVADVAARIDPAMDTGDLWSAWLNAGIPGGVALAKACFARAEEHRWREQSAQRVAPPPILADGDEAPGESAATLSISATDRAQLALRIADRRRFDAAGHPALAVADVDHDLYRDLLRDIAAWRLDTIGGDPVRAAALGDRVRAATDDHKGESGMADAGAAYAKILGKDMPRAAAEAIARHDWPTLIALAAAAWGRAYADMALALLSAQTAALPSLLAPLRIDRAALAPLEASLAMLPARAVAADGAEVGGEPPSRDGQW
ncbi:hypothetical protein [Sphingopyxis solisilvae]|uniref:hypothetical protein n=1 Tax=Sphingopyxis solisilvae TaxID=1886788 RepID=UPI001892A9E4|nr:hypothetical protein [Sphingopyxis solisilvae]